MCVCARCKVIQQLTKKQKIKNTRALPHTSWVAMCMFLWLVARCNKQTSLARPGVSGSQQFAELCFNCGYNNSTAKYISLRFCTQSWYCCLLS